MTGVPPRVTPLTGAPASALPALAAAVLDAREGFRDSARLHTERAGQLGWRHPIRAALCRGQAMACEAAAEQIGEAVAIASGRWGQQRAVDTR